MLNEFLIEKGLCHESDEKEVCEIIAFTKNNAWPSNNAFGKISCTVFTQFLISYFEFYPIDIKSRNMNKISDLISLYQNLPIISGILE